MPVSPSTRLSLPVYSKGSVDGHGKEDVVNYRKQVFLPKWKEIMDHMGLWDKDFKEHLPSEEGKRIIAWFHEPVFYAHDRRKKGWYHKDASAKPYAKGEGTSLMIADFVSADFGRWLTSPDEKQSARQLFKPEKNRASR